jgi:transcriptional regulator with XRE-family HTH domain
LSQSAMGAKLNVSFQQFQKYESGKNRLGAARSYEICEALGVSPSSIFERELKALSTVAVLSRDDQHLPT